MHHQITTFRFATISPLIIWLKITVTLVCQMLQFPIVAESNRKKSCTKFHRFPLLGTSWTTANQTSHQTNHKQAPEGRWPFLFSPQTEINSHFHSQRYFCLCVCLCVCAHISTHFLLWQLSSVHHHQRKTRARGSRLPRAFKSLHNSLHGTVTKHARLAWRAAESRSGPVRGSLRSVATVVVAWPSNHLASLHDRARERERGSKRESEWVHRASERSASDEPNARLLSKLTNITF